MNDYERGTISNFTTATGISNGIMGSNNYEYSYTPTSWEFTPLSPPSMGVSPAPKEPIIKNKSLKMEVELCLCSSELWK